MLRILALAKQVIDPEMPRSAFVVDRTNRCVEPPGNLPPVVNGFDENAVEAALRIKDAQADVTITVLSLGDSFALDVMKKPLSMGADELVLVQDAAFANTVDSFAVATVLAAAIEKLGAFDLIIAGRQASDWDNAQVPLLLAEMLSLPSLTIGKQVEVADAVATVHRQTPDGTEIVEADLPVLVTVSNELGQPRYPTLRGIMAATRKQPTVWSLADLGLDATALSPMVEAVDLYVPESDVECEFIAGEDDADSGRMLALKLREAKLI